MRLFALLVALALLAGCGQGQADGPQADSLPISEPAASEPDRQEEPSVRQPQAPPDDPTAFVRVRDYIPDLVVDLRYATPDNFTGRVIYAYDDAWLRYATVCKLARAQELLGDRGYRLCIWDAFRSAQSQQTLWQVCPDGNYVADPSKGYSGHTRGDTVDVTLVTAAGETVEMPSGFDDFSALADREYSDVSQAAAAHAALLEEVMTACGFVGYDKEWWHYSDCDRAQPAPTFEPET